MISTESPGRIRSVPAGRSTKQLQPIMLRICPLDCAPGRDTAPSRQTPRRNRRDGLRLEKPFSARAAARRS